MMLGLYFCNQSEFQSTLPRRERLFGQIRMAMVDDISIHAPAKGATLSNVASCAGLIFQSTLPRRERHQKSNRV